MKLYNCVFCVASLIVCSLIGNEFVSKPSKSKNPKISTASVRQACCTALADVHELSHACVQSALDGHKSCMEQLHAWLGDENSFLSHALKNELCDTRDTIVALKKRYTKVRDELKALADELRAVQASCQ